MANEVEGGHCDRGEREGENARPARKPDAATRPTALARFLDVKGHPNCSSPASTNDPRQSCNFHVSQIFLKAR